MGDCADARLQVELDEPPAEASAHGGHNWKLNKARSGLHGGPVAWALKTSCFSFDASDELQFLGSYIRKVSDGDAIRTDAGTPKVALAALSLEGCNPSKVGRLFVTDTGW